MYENCVGVHTSCLRPPKVGYFRMSAADGELPPAHVHRKASQV